MGGGHRYDLCAKGIESAIDLLMATKRIQKIQSGRSNNFAKRLGSIDRKLLDKGRRKRSFSPAQARSTYADAAHSIDLYVQFRTGI
jgi:hypothetical protein